ncbi:MAG TPA: DUF3515 domain-containing protein [Nocardioidaceae bacterium]|nr:DUF3515 domain-containing protein [Nocardioidaceae bacterium]
MGAVACLALLGGLATGCGSGAVEVDTPQLEGDDARACARLVDALPETVSDQERRQVEPEDAYGAAWGDPAIVLRCGVAMPGSFDDFATCQETNGVGWFIPEEQLTGEPREIVMTTIGRSQNVEVRLPAAYWPPAAAMVDLAPALKLATVEEKPCV